MTKAKLLLTGLLTGAMLLGAGCATTRSQASDPAPGTGGAGLDPNPANNVPGTPTSVDGAPVNAPTADGVPAPGAPAPMPP